MNAILKNHNENPSTSINPNDLLLAALEKGSRQETLRALSAGADANATFSGGYPAIYLAISRAFVAGGKKNGLATLKVLIEKDADLNQTNESGRAALHLAAWKGIVSATLELVKNGADVLQEDKWGNNALHLVGGSQEVPDQQKREIASILMRAGINPLIKNKEGYTAIESAKSRGAILAVEAMESFVKIMNKAEERIDSAALDGRMLPRLKNKL